jgi:predicted MFS family arabinose efflux permease
MVIMALALWRGLPKVKQDNHLNYPQLLGSIFSLFAKDKVLRTRALLGCLSFANFSILWTSMAFLLASPPFNFSEGVIGLFGLVGAAGALGARPFGSLADKGKAHLTTTVGLGLLLLSWRLSPGTKFGAGADRRYSGARLTVQGVHITNQTVIYRLKPEARNRLTAGYMTSYFVGGAAGSLISASAWQHAGWTGVSIAGASFAALNLLVWWRGYQNPQKAE